MAYKKIAVDKDEVKITEIKKEMIRGGKVREMVTEVCCKVIGVKCFSKIRKASAKESGVSDCL